MKFNFGRKILYPKSRLYVKSRFVKSRLDCCVPCLCLLAGTFWQPRWDGHFNWANLIENKTSHFKNILLSVVVVTLSGVHFIGNFSVMTQGFNVVVGHKIFFCLTDEYSENCVMEGYFRTIDECAKELIKMVSSCFQCIIQRPPDITNQLGQANYSLNP